jgi:hypothetical protein
MTSFQPSQIIEEFKNFVHSSCTDCETEMEKFSSLHKGIIKMYFGARRVEIDYKQQTIKAEIPVSDHEYTTVNFECQDLDRFLSSCLKKDKRSLNFYQSSLNYYNHIPEALSQVA